jgi:hypothetical protein
MRAEGTFTVAFAHAATTTAFGTDRTAAFSTIVAASETGGPAGITGGGGPARDPDGTTASGSSSTSADAASGPGPRRPVDQSWWKISGSCSHHSPAAAASTGS